MENSVKFFGFNTLNQSVIMRDTTMDEIKAALSAKFPKWSKENLDKILSNQSFFKEPSKFITIDRIKFVSPKPTYYSSKKKKTPLIELMDLALSFYCYHKNANRQWGNVTNLLFDDANISHSWGRFDKAFKNCHKAYNKAEYADVFNDLVEVMVNDLVLLSKTIKHRAKFELDKHKEQDWVKGSADGRRLGISELMGRIDGVISMIKA